MAIHAARVSCVHVVFIIMVISISFLLLVYVTLLQPLGQTRESKIGGEILKQTVSISSPISFFRGSNANSSEKKMYPTHDHPNGTTTTLINKTIYMLWFQGFDQAPEVVRWCVRSWKHYNPTWKLVLLDNTNLHHYISSTDMQKYIPNQATMLPAHVSDVIRLILLERFGGLWIDSTVFCNRPLNDWLFGRNTSAGFFAFSKPGPDRLLSNWFLFSLKHSYLTAQWANATIHYHTHHPIAEFYFIQHYLFQSLYDHNRHFQSIWNQVPQILVPGGPHYFLERGYMTPLTKDVILSVNSKAIPVYKLTWKNITIGDVVSTTRLRRDSLKTTTITNVEYLFSTILP